MIQQKFIPNKNVEFFDLITTRHSVRAFKDEAVPEETIEKILFAANSAPSAGNLQSYKIFAVTRKEDRRKLAAASHQQDFIEDASAVLVFCADLRTASEYGNRGKELYCIQDATIACAYSQLAVHALGLASVWVGAFDEEEVKRCIDSDNNLKPVAMLVLGFPNEEAEITNRKPLNEISKII